VRLLCALTGLFLMIGSVDAEEPIQFNDSELKAAVEHELWISDPTPTDMLALTALYANGHDIDDLTGLEYAKNLQTLELAYNHITDMSPLSGLSRLELLVLNNNAVGNLSVVSGLTALAYLDVHDNGLSDISPVSTLSNLRTLILRFNQIADLSPLSTLSNLEDLDLRENAISDLAGLSGLQSLRDLNLYGNQISNLSPLSGLHGLETLMLQCNEISDISSLAGLTGLRALDLERNQISDISAASSLTNLRELSLCSNNVSDISPLSALISLRELNLEANPLNEEACDIYIPQIKANNPSIRLTSSTFCSGRLRLSSTAGGSIRHPGEGEFVYNRGETVLIEAEADPCFVFVNFTGSVFTCDSPISVTMSQDQEICAHFLSVLDVLHVDDDAPNDPRPGDAAISDPGENGTREHPFDRIQEAIDVAAGGATIFVHTGTYHENIDLLGKCIELTGFDPTDPNRAMWPVIDGAGAGPVVSFIHGEAPDCLLAGLVITGARDGQAEAIRCTAASPTIANCLIVGNRVTDSAGATVSCTDSRAALINCTVADNHAGKSGAAVHLCNSLVMIINGILWGNTPREILCDGMQAPLIRHSAISGGWPGPGNLATDPLFAGHGRWVDRNDLAIAVSPDDPDAIWAMGDYHLQSQAGCWDPEEAAWQQDGATSPCIDAGDPTAPVGGEPLPNGGVINMGAYGGTLQASKSPASLP
jgi:Leucine-rich repeat (LRR) protein